MVLTGYSYFMLVSCFSFVIAIFSLYWAYRFITGKELYKFKNKRIVKVINLLAGCILLIGSFYVTKSYLSDMINYQPKQFIGTVVDIRNTVQSSFIYEKVRMDNHMTYYVFFNKFTLEEDKTYTITYLPHSKLILDAHESE